MVGSMLKLETPEGWFDTVSGILVDSSPSGIEPLFTVSTVVLLSAAKEMVDCTDGDTLKVDVTAFRINLYSTPEVNPARLLNLLVGVSPPQIWLGLPEQGVLQLLSGSTFSMLSEQKQRPGWMRAYVYESPLSAVEQNKSQWVGVSVIAGSVLLIGAMSGKPVFPGSE
jgi:hypothetical protein